MQAEGPRVDLSILMLVRNAILIDHWTVVHLLGVKTDGVGICFGVSKFMLYPGLRCGVSIFVRLRNYALIGCCSIA